MLYIHISIFHLNFGLQLLHRFCLVETSGKRIDFAWRALLAYSTQFVLALPAVAVFDSQYWSILALCLLLTAS